MTESEYRVRVDNVSKVFGPDPQNGLDLVEQGHGKDEIFEKTGNVVAVANVSFSVKPGETFVVMGLSGSGKSTLIRCINRLIEPTSGSIYIDEEEIVGADQERLRQVRLKKMAMVFQHFALFPHKTVAENVEYGLKIQGVGGADRRERAISALQQVGLEAWADNPPANLSGGMQQRVGLARALAVDPQILLMDEPFSALDPLIRRNMQEELLQLQKQVHKTIIFITHDLHEALILGDRIAIMKEGRFVQLGRPQEIVAHPADDYVAAFTQDVDRSRVFTAGWAMRDALALVRDRDKVGDALAHLDDLDRDFVYVIDDAGKPVGLAARRDLVDRARDEALDSHLRTDFPVADASAELVEIYDRCSRGLPVAVLDPEGRLQGALAPLEVFDLLSGGKSGSDRDKTAEGEVSGQASRHD